MDSDNDIDDNSSLIEEDQFDAISDDSSSIASTVSLLMLTSKVNITTVSDTRVQHEFVCQLCVKN